MDFGIFYEIQVNSPLKHREREYQAFHDVLKQVETAEQVGFTHFWTVEHHFQVGFAHSSVSFRRACLIFVLIPSATLADGSE